VLSGRELAFKSKVLALAIRAVKKQTIIIIFKNFLIRTIVQSCIEFINKWLIKLILFNFYVNIFLFRVWGICKAIADLNEDMV